MLTQQHQTNESPPNCGGHPGQELIGMTSAQTQDGRKRQYTRPTLMKLGTVAELTFAGTTGDGDGTNPLDGDSQTAS